MTEELESHLLLEVDELVRRGMNPDEACRQALIQSGGIDGAREAYRDQRGFPLLDHVRRDLVFAGRMMRRNPGVTAVVVISLGLANSANTAIFSLTDAIFLRSLPVADPEDLVLFEWVGPGGGGQTGGLLGRLFRLDPGGRHAR